MCLGPQLVDLSLNAPLIKKRSLLVVHSFGVQIVCIHRILFELCVTGGSILAMDLVPASGEGSKEERRLDGHSSQESPVCIPPMKTQEFFHVTEKSW